MPAPIERLNASDYPQLITMLNRSFAVEGSQSFDTLIPGLYQPTDEIMAYNYAIRCDSTIAAVAAIYPMAWRVGDTSLRVAGVAGVAVAPEFRGQNLMNQLMAHLVSEIRREDYPLSYLGGQRQRYRYFGWEVAGVKIEAAVNSDNVRHLFKNQPRHAITLRQAADDPALIDALKQLHDHYGGGYVRSRECFARVVRNWGATPKAACNRDGKLIGYAVSNGERVLEMVATDAAYVPSLVAALVEASPGGHVRISLAPALRNTIRIVGEFAETMHTMRSVNWQIFDWVAVIRALLTEAHQQTPLALGSTIIAIEGQPDAIAMQVTGRQVRVEPHTGPAHLKLDAATMMRVLFGPLQPDLVTNLPPAAAILQAWCPLPLQRDDLQI
jgi:predicted acetyltransferase